MQLDCNRIVIRERGLFDQFDLALYLIRVYLVPIVLAMLLGALPATLFNFWLIAKLEIPIFNYEDAPFGFLFTTLLLTILEIPLVTAPVTLYLGNAVFQEHPRPGELFWTFLRMLPQLIFYQVILRALMMPLVVTWFFPSVKYPYLLEILLLEQTPFRERMGHINTRRRSMYLHGGNLGDLFGRFLLVAGLAVVMFLAMWMSLGILAGLLFNTWEFNDLTFVVYYPVALWIVVGYFAVARFLGYLDLRIRREGWEIELLMRAEGERLSRQPI